MKVHDKLVSTKTGNLMTSETTYIACSKKFLYIDKNLDKIQIAPKRIPEYTTLPLNNKHPDLLLPPYLLLLPPDLLLLPPDLLLLPPDLLLLSLEGTVVVTGLLLCPRPPVVSHRLSVVAPGPPY